MSSSRYDGKRIPSSATYVLPEEEAMLDLKWFLEYIPLEYYKMVALDDSLGDITLQLTEDAASKICLHAVDLCPSHIGSIMLTGIGRPGILKVSVAKLKKLGVI